MVRTTWASAPAVDLLVRETGEVMTAHRGDACRSLAGSPVGCTARYPRTGEVEGRVTWRALSREPSGLLALGEHNMVVSGAGGVGLLPVDDDRAVLPALLRQR